ncbi:MULTISPECIES: LysR family transcriptional regulator [Streptomyces]|uniref:LysR family transcriptional regulator n=2 Tax=Streptomyces nigrescens TaxID=1920 RepID=A0A640TC44_STRNI|nr:MULTISPECIES: LysR family transcriptional regulator [Streptomyces]WAT95535.1 LysR substrate-binding domain-containing protein [Streptomyces libani subsp. libani]WAU03159.1 LysR substrate-binding domain-containing protein [Streptomyces nigrescens]WDT58849.1 LysR substrate-binding domain-containing protein [Streptomyces sp. G7(2002)]GFE20770.1 LysR family transcriptional regulator [Streptomyces libani subsp. libani]GGV88089.1 LysR family transcriptional regulator [Streptomyces libani subsp. l
MTLNLPQLRAFLAVVDAGGFSAAAAELGMSQSAVSHAVASLERELTAPLLIRASPVRTTVLGAKVLPHARMALSAVRSVEQLAADAGGTMTGTVRLASTPTVCQGLVPGLLRHWREDQPRITVRVFEGDSAEVAAWLEDGTADAAVLIDPPPATAGKYPWSGPGIELATDEYRALLPRDHPLADEPRVDIRDLEDDPFLISPNGCEARVRTLHSLAGLRFSPTHRVRDLATLISMVQAGLGVTVLSEVSRSLIPSDLVLLPLQPQTSRRLVLTGPQARPWHPALRTLAESAAGHLVRSVSRPAAPAEGHSLPSGSR